MFKKKPYEFNLGSERADFFARMMMSFALDDKKETAHRHLDYLMKQLNKLEHQSNGVDNNE